MSPWIIWQLGVRSLEDEMLSFFSNNLVSACPDFSLFHHLDFSMQQESLMIQINLSCCLAQKRWSRDKGALILLVSEARASPQLSPIPSFRLVSSLHQDFRTQFASVTPLSSQLMTWCSISAVRRWDLLEVRMKKAHVILSWELDRLLPCGALKRSLTL